MSAFFPWFVCYSLSLILSSVLSQRVSDDESNVPLTPYQLSYTPAHVVNHVTHDITILCAHEGDTPSQLEVINWIRLLKKSSTGWQLLAELRDNEPEPRAMVDVSVSAQLSQNVQDTFLQVTWPVATPDTFGTYRCDVIGLKSLTLHVATEVTSEIAILEEEITASDMLDIFKKTKDDLTSVADTTDRLKENMNIINGKLNTFQGELDGQNEDVVMLGEKMNLTRKTVTSVAGEVDNLTESVDSLVARMGTLDNIPLTETASELRKEITSLSNDVSSVNGRMDNVEEKIEVYNDGTRDHDSLIKRVDVVSGIIAALKANESQLSRDVNSVAGEMTGTQNDVQQIKDTFNYRLGAMDNEMTSLKREISDLNTLVLTQAEEQLVWPAGQYALLQPRTGCPRDLEFIGGTDKYVKLHTQSGSGSNSDRDRFEILSIGSVSREDSQNFFTLQFCEASGQFSANWWPRGSYCINRIYMEDCPDVFRGATVRLDIEDSNKRTDYTSRAASNANTLLFCCRSDGSQSTPMDLPTRSPFLLYRVGGRCQKIRGMNVAEVDIDIDTEDTNNNDNASSGGPDVDITHTSPARFYLCSYTKA